MAKAARKIGKSASAGSKRTGVTSGRSAAAAAARSMDKRTIIVLTSLLAAMTSSAALLLALEPSPIAPTAGAQLLSTDQTSNPADQLFDTSDARPWQGIVIYDSGSVQGNLQSIDEVHRRLGNGGVGYHFVLANGQGGPDGQIEVGYRWKRQLIGAHATGEHAPWFNQSAIGICYIGDSDKQAPTDSQSKRLLWLVHQLQEKYNIPADRVYVRTGSGRGTSLFPIASFRQQLLAVK